MAANKYPERVNITARIECVNESLGYVSAQLDTLISLADDVFKNPIKEKMVAQLRVSLDKIELAQRALAGK